MLQPLSCHRGRKLLWPMIFALFTDCIHCHGVASTSQQISDLIKPCCLIVHSSMTTVPFDNWVPQWQLRCSVTKAFQKVWSGSKPSLVPRLISSFHVQEESGNERRNSLGMRLIKAFLFSAKGVVCKTTPPPIDSYQLSIKRATFGGQIRDQEAAVQQTFHLERTSFSFSTYGT